jgi:hypothetical protein
MARVYSVSSRLRATLKMETAQIIAGCRPERLAEVQTDCVARIGREPADRVAERGARTPAVAATRAVWYTAAGAFPGIAAESIRSKREKEDCSTGNLLAIRSALPSVRSMLLRMVAYASEHLAQHPEGEEPKSFPWN